MLMSLLLVVVRKGFAVCAERARMGKDYEVQEGDEDGPVVVYHCPECGRQIESLLADAGSKDNCPECGKAVTIPGEAELRLLQDSPRQDSDISGIFPGK